ncbi:MAG: aldehyde dehydrogenase family protein [Tabrizicola sp.]|nr:aldehyde dehydrogenase family protein [Tabrizicola sp.]
MAYLRAGWTSFDRLDPARGGVASTAPACGVREATAAANAAARAFAGWAATAPSERRRILMRAADMVTRHAGAIGQAMRAEIGATGDWIAHNLTVATAHLEEAASHVTQIDGRVSQDLTSFALREPAGVCLAIAPWNAPFVLGIRSVATALACGNSVVFKASELCPATHLLVGQVLADAGLPEGVLNIVTHAPDDAARVVETLIAHPAVRRINFTGSTRVGRMVAETAARHLKRCLLELGGKAPFVVLEDADLEAAAQAAAIGAFLNQGQVCMSTDRIVVMDSVAEPFARLLAAEARKYLAGDPASGEWALGPVISSTVARRLSDLLSDATQRGGQVLAGGRITGTFMDATVVDHVRPGMAIYAEECFGPIATICRASSQDDAIAIANDTDYGLSAAVFSRDIDRALGVARQIETGICHINAPTVHDRPDMPFGGVKASGYGRFGGPSTLDEFTELRWITIPAGQ